MFAEVWFPVLFGCASSGCAASQQACFAAAATVDKTQVAAAAAAVLYSQTEPLLLVRALLSYTFFEFLIFLS